MAKSAVKKINGIDISEFKGFGYDGCHKIYLFKSARDKKLLENLGYDIYELDKRLIQCYLDSCSLRFIDISDGENISIIVPQFCERVIFEGFKDIDKIDNENMNLVTTLAGDKVIVEMASEYMEA